MEKIFELLTKVPKGKVVTYKQVAELTGIKNPRQVGRILHGNPDPETFPCHRVVKSDGSLAIGYAFGGQNSQQKLLEDEGITFHSGKIDLAKYRWFSE